MVVPEGLKEKAPFWSQVIENHDLYEINQDMIVPPIGCDVSLDIGNWKCCVAGEVYGFNDRYIRGCDICSYFSRALGTQDDPSDFEQALFDFNNHLNVCKYYASERK